MKLSIQHLRKLIERHGLSHEDCVEKPDLVRPPTRVLSSIEGGVERLKMCSGHFRAFEVLHM